VLRMSIVQVAAAVGASALLLSGCSTDEPQDDAAPSVSATPTPSSTVPVPEGVEVTTAGAQLAFGDTATVAHEAEGRAGVLALTVESAVQGKRADLKGFDLDDPYKKNGNYYYVRVSVENAGETVLGELPVPLWGVSGQNTLLQAVEFTSAFKKCPTEKLPKRFRPGDTFKTCLVYLSPDHGALDAVSYRPDPEFVPIEWHGNVKMQPKPSKAPSSRPSASAKAGG
jgi:hypothetical protein